MNDLVKNIDYSFTALFGKKANLIIQKEEHRVHMNEKGKHSGTKGLIKRLNVHHGNNKNL